MVKELIERFVAKITYLESEREQILKETLTFIASINKPLNNKEKLKLIKRKALKIADRMIEKGQENPPQE